jgi:hypothetical protein
MRQVQFKCDGCDKIVIVHKDLTLPLYWECVNNQYKKTYDLCPNCVAHYNLVSDPANWPRPENKP